MNGAQRWREGGRGLAAWLAVLALVGASAWVRIDTAFADPNFDRAHAEGMLKSDPALLYYITERIVESGGRPPDDFRADPRVQYPGLTDLAAEFTVGQEFLAAWAWRAWGGGMPLHAFCVVFFAFVASLAALGVYGLAREVTRSRGWGLVAALLWSLLPGNYRTIGFILIREDLSFPLFALHLWLLARAWRVGSARAYLLAGLLLAAALATWHAMVFVVALEAACAMLWILRTGRGPFARPSAAALLVFPVVAAVLVPALREAWLLTSLPLALGFGMFAADFLRARRGVGRSPASLVALLAAGAVLAGGAWGSGGAYTHVWEVLGAKIVHLGVRPVDPGALSFDARLLWQGPFETLTLGGLWVCLGWTLPLGAATVPRALTAWRGGERAKEAALFAFLWVSLPAAWLVERMVILPALLVPVAGALVLARLARLERRRIAVALAASLLLLQGVQGANALLHYRNVWYLPPGRQTEIAELVAWIDGNLEEDAAITADFMNSTAILAHTRRPIVLQPKYETARSRRRAQAFYETFFQGTAEDVRRLVRDRFRCAYVLFDRYTLQWISSYLGGLRPDEGGPRPGTAAALFLSQDPEVLTGVPGFELLYRSPPTIRQMNGEPYDFFRLYRVTD